MWRMTSCIFCYCQVTPAPCHPSWSWKKRYVSMNSTKIRSSLSTVSLSHFHADGVDNLYIFSSLPSVPAITFPLGSAERIFIFSLLQRACTHFTYIWATTYASYHSIITPFSWQSDCCLGSPQTLDVLIQEIFLWFCGLFWLTDLLNFPSACIFLQLFFCFDSGVCRSRVPQCVPQFWKIVLLYSLREVEVRVLHVE